MTLTPQDHALLGRVQDITRAVAQIVTSYRQELERGGMNEDEAFDTALCLEERLLGPVFDQAEAELREAPWVDVEALFLAVVNLQLVLGQAPSAPDAVRYMQQAGVRVGKPSEEQILNLAERTPISVDEIWRAFRQAWMAGGSE